jgi:competence protein ComGC
VVGTMAAPAIDREHTARRYRARGFSLVDVLVTLAVISVLIGLLLPTLSGVRETTRQVVCRSNVRQIGFGIILFADDRQQNLPPSEYVRNHQPHRTTQVRRENTQLPWDGLGYLFSEDYLPAAGVFYCPSHTGSNPLSAYSQRWALSAAEAYPSQLDIITNYQYRGTPTGGGYRPRAALVTDALTNRDDFNHQIGANLLRADFSANWYPDPSGRIAGDLPAANDADPTAASKVNDVWDRLDLPTDGGP